MSMDKHSFILTMCYLKNREIQWIHEESILVRVMLGKLMISENIAICSWSGRLFHDLSRSPRIQESSRSYGFYVNMLLIGNREFLIYNIHEQK